MARRTLGCAVIAALALASAPPSSARTEPLTLIVSSAWEEARAVELRDLRAIYLGGRTRLFGKRVRRIDLPSGSASREGFSRSVLGRPEAELERYWIEQALSGGALPPRQVATPADVVAAVRARAGTLGYLPASALRTLDLSGVRTLPLVVDGVVLDADAPGYPAQSRD